MRRKIYFLIFIFLAGLFFYYYFYFRNKEVDNINLPPAQTYQDIKANTSIAVPDKNPTSTPIKNDNTNTVTEPVVKPVENLADVNLAVPFTSQAPTANWAEPFQNACEEASLLMVDYYYANKKMPDKLAVEKILVAMVDWQKQNWGGHFELPIAKEAELALAMYNQKTEIVNDLTVEKIKVLLKQGRPVIVPADGKKLDNPNFTNGGPVYHMLVIKGFTGDKFITNDPGTRKGADFIYTQSNLMYSLADWDTNKNAASGGKVGLVFAL